MKQATRTSFAVKSVTAEIKRATRHLMESSTRIKLRQKVDYTSKQSPHEHLPETPLRGLLLGPSAAGKSSVLVGIVLRLYHGLFERVYIFSPSVHLDSSWAPVKQYVEQTLGVGTNEEPAFFDTWDTEALQNIFESQVQLIQEAKMGRLKQMFNILILADDFADDPCVCAINLEALPVEEAY